MTKEFWSHPLRHLALAALGTVTWACSAQSESHQAAEVVAMQQSAETAARECPGGCSGEETCVFSCGPEITIHCGGYDGGSSVTFTVPSNTAACVPRCPTAKVDCGGRDAYAADVFCPGLPAAFVDPLPADYVPPDGCTVKYYCI